MNPLLSTMLVVAISIISLILVLTISSSTLAASKESAQISNMEVIMKSIDKSISEVVAEGAGAKRLLTVTSDGDITVMKDDAVEYKIITNAQFIDFFSRRTSGNIMFISGNDVSCYDDGSLVMENTFIKATFVRVSPVSSLDTKDIIQSIQEKSSGTTISIVNSSIVINENIATSFGLGYTEIMNPGTALPECTIHAFVNATDITYDVFYILYAGADFIVSDVRNIQQY